MNYDTDGIAMIMNRRSCKNYLPQLPQRHLIAEVVEAGRSAPSGMNRQMCHFLVITRQTLLSQLSDLVSRRLEPFARRDFRYAAPVMVVLCHQKSVTVALQDAGCAMENMLLAAYSLGLGARWINQLWRLSDDPELRALLGPVGLEKEEQVICSLILGWPDGPLPERREPTGNRVTWVED